LTATQPEAILAAPSSRSRRKPLHQALLLTGGLRLFYTVAAAFFSPHLRLDPALIHSNKLTENVMSRDAHPALYALLGVWERFDTLWYIHIAHRGYADQAATVFYPFYPALIRIVSLVAGSDLLAALGISTAASFFLFRGALRLFELDYAPDRALRAILLWAIWPASFIFFAGYPDSLLCACLVWALYFARRGHWLPSAAIGFAAGLTKAIGGFLAVPLLWIAWRRREARGFAAAFLPAAGVAGFQAFLALRHFPPAAQIYKTYWATSTVAPWTTLIDALTSATQRFDLLLLLNLAIFLAVGAAALTPSVRFEYKALTVAAMCLFLTKHTQPLLQSTMRYSLTIFAAFPSLSTVRGLPFLLLALVAFSLNLLLFWTFLNWGLAV
jgi:hypothetical protein